MTWPPPQKGPMEKECSMCGLVIEGRDGFHVGLGARVHKVTCLADYLLDLMPEGFDEVIAEGEDAALEAAREEGWKVTVYVTVWDPKGEGVYETCTFEELGEEYLALAYQAAKFIESQEAS